MPNFLVVSARNWEPTRVDCTFTVKANGTVLKPLPTNPQFFDVPANTTTLEITATPTKNNYWADTFVLSSNGGVFVPARPGFVTVLQLPLISFTIVICNLNRFRDVSNKVLATLATPPSPRVLPANPDAQLIQPRQLSVRRTKAEDSQTDEVAILSSQYGSWPPTTWEPPWLSTATYADGQQLVVNKALNFPTAPAPVAPNADTAVLELKRGTSPTIFGVTWPRALGPKPEVAPPILIFLRQTGGQNLKNGVFSAPQTYPFSFDYAERCLVESMRYGQTALLKTVPARAATTARVWSDNLADTLRPKGVPYQVAASGHDVVVVYPVAEAGGGEYGGLQDTNVIPGILGELQAFMFWRSGVKQWPTSIGRVGISAFSSANYTLARWLELGGNVNGKFMRDHLVAVYLLDPPALAMNVVTNAMAWADKGTDRAVRLYGRGVQAVKGKPNQSQDQFSDIHEQLCEWTGAHPDTPYIKTARDNKRMAALLPTAAWQALFIRLGLGSTTSNIREWDVHHLIPATMLKHALAQGDLF